MAIGTPTDIGGSQISGLTTTNTVTLTTTVQVDVGDTLIVVVASSTTNRTLNTVADNVAGSTNSYSIGVTANDGTNAENLWFVSCDVTSTIAAGKILTATFANSVSSVRGIAAFKVSGLGVLDISSVNTGTSSAWSTTPGASTNQTDELLVAAAWIATNATNTPATCITGGTGATYTELARDGGGVMDFQGGSRSFVIEYTIVAATNASYRGAGTWSAGSARWRAAFAAFKADITGAFTNTVPPSVSGSLNIGGTLTADPGTWSPTPGSYTYFWHRAEDTVGTNLQEISTATGATYTLDSADANMYLQAGVIPNP